MEGCRKEKGEKDTSRNRGNSDGPTGEEVGRGWPWPHQYSYLPHSLSEKLFSKASNSHLFFADMRASSSLSYWQNTVTLPISLRHHPRLSTSLDILWLLAQRRGRELCPCRYTAHANMTDPPPNVLKNILMMQRSHIRSASPANLLHLLSQ